VDILLVVEEGETTQLLEQVVVVEEDLEQPLRLVLRALVRLVVVPVEEELVVMIVLEVPVSW
jgi:hypothetical protein